MKPAKMIGFISIVMVFDSWALLAQTQPTTISDASQRLTGGASRLWVHEKTVSTMGPSGDRCTSGRTYRFAQQNSILTISECKDGAMVKSNHTWALKEASEIDIVLTIDNSQPYKLSFNDTGGEHLMRLRSDTVSQTTPNTDMVFRIGAD
jgi:hypothetical protein